MEPGSLIPLDGLRQQFDSSGGLEGLFQWLGSDQPELDPEGINRELHTSEGINRELHTSTKIPLDEEKVLRAFKAGRTSTLLTKLCAS